MKTLLIHMKLYFGLFGSRNNFPRMKMRYAKKIHVD